MFLSAKRPFYNSTQIMNLTTIAPESYYTFAVRLFGEGGWTIDKSLFMFIYKCFGGYSWYVQTILNRLYETEDNITDKSQVTEAIRDIVRENTMVYQICL